MPCSHCERPSCLPEDYVPLCSRHYLISIKEAQQAAEARFRAHIEHLVSEKEKAVSLG